MSLKPLKNNVLIQAKKAPTTTIGGIIIEGGNGEPDRAVVKAVGSTVENVKVGDELLVDWMKAKNVPDRSGTLWMIDEENIIAVFES